MMGRGRDDLVPGRLRWTVLTPNEWSDADERAMAKFSATELANHFGQRPMVRTGAVDR